MNCGMRPAVSRSMSSCLLASRKLVPWLLILVPEMKKKYIRKVLSLHAGRDISETGPNHFMKKKLWVIELLWFHFWLGPIHKLFKSDVHFAVRWILRILGPFIFPILANQNFKWPIKTLILHVNEWDMGHWAIFMANSYSGPELTLCWVNFHALLHAFSLKNYLFTKSFRNTVVKHFGSTSGLTLCLAWSQLGPNCLQRLSADNKSCHWRKSINLYRLGSLYVS